MPFRAVAANRDTSSPYAMWMLIAVVLLFGTLSGRVYFFMYIQFVVAVTVASALWKYLVTSFFPAKLAADATAKAKAREPSTIAEYKTWLFRHTHEKLPPSEQPLQFYRDLYMKHRESVVGAVEPSGVASASATRAYVDDRGAVYRAPPIAPLSPSEVAMMLVVGCTLGGLTCTVCARAVPPLRLPRFLFSAWELPNPWLPPGLLGPLLAIDYVLSCAPRWLGRALGVAIAATLFGRHVRPNARMRLGVVVFWSTLVSAAVEVHLTTLWFEGIARILLVTLGPLGEPFVLSTLTLPLLHVLVPAAAAVLAFGRLAKPAAEPAAESAGARLGTPVDGAADGLSSTRSAAGVSWRSRRHRRSWAPLVILSALHAAMLTAHLQQHPPHRAYAAELGGLAQRGEWRALLSSLSSAAWSGAWRAPPPPPPGAPPSEDDEARACAVLGVSRSADWTAIKAAYRALALEHHPDKLRAKLGREPTEEEVAESERRFHEVRHAHEVLDAIHQARAEHANLRQEL